MGSVAYCLRMRVGRNHQTVGPNQSPTNCQGVPAREASAMFVTSSFLGMLGFSSLSGTQVSRKLTRMDLVAFEGRAIRQTKNHPRDDLMNSSSKKYELPSIGYIRLSKVLLIFPVSRASWWSGIRSGRYPAGVKIGPRITAWRVDDIRKLLEEGRIDSDS